MDERITEFVRGLRAAGVRVSLAEAVDAFRAVQLLGVGEKALFRESLRATLIKENKDFPIFDRLFPVYFAAGGPPLADARDALNEAERSALQEALQAFNERTQRLLDWLTGGEPPSREELETLARQLAQRWRDSPRKAEWVTSSMLRELGFNDLEQNLGRLMQRLQEMGVRPEAIDGLLGIVRENAANVREQVSRQVGLEVARERAERTGNGTGVGNELRGSDNDIMERPFEALSYTDTEQLRLEVRRLVQQLRSRAALRRKRGDDGKFDPKATIRHSLRYGGVPLDLHFRKRKIKPSLVFLVDVSGSMERIVEFLLRFVYQLNDQVSRIRIFTYYADLSELHPKVIELVGNNNVEDAFYVIRSVHPYRPYATNLGHSLQTFHNQHLASVDGRSTVVVLGDGRNNYTDPRVDLLRDIQQRARRLIWLNPEHRAQWGQGDSDMARYEPYCNEVFTVGNLAQLSHAIDNLLTV